MALLFLDSFQNIDTANHRTLWNGSNNLQISTGIYRSPHSQSSFRTNTADQILILPASLARADMYVGFSFYVNTATDPSYWTNHCFVGFAYQSTIHCNVCWNTARYPLGVRFNSAVLGAAGSIPYQNYTWHYMEVYAKIHDTTGEFRVWIDNELSAEYTSVDTSKGTNLIDRVYLAGVYNLGWVTYFNDFYIDSDTRHGPCKVLGVMPDADGSYTEWSPLGAGDHYVEIDEVAPDGDSSYNESDTEGQKDSYTITAPSANVIKGMQIKSMVKRYGDIAPGKVRHFVRQGGSDYSASVGERTLGATYSFIFDCWDDDPNDSNPWTQAKLNSMEAGIEATYLGTTTTSTTSTTTTTAP